MYYKGYDINVILLNDANGVPGSVWHNSDDSYTIFIDARLSTEKQKEVFEHETNHIINDDFEKTDVQQIETEAHGLKIPDNVERIPANKFKKHLDQLRRERSRIQSELQKKEKEIEFLIEVNGCDSFLFDSAEYHKFYGWQ